jgi:hypothetical protein
MEDTTRIEQSKFAVGPDGRDGTESPGVDAGELPWAYGEDRITAIARDPDSAFLYWEVTDDGIAAARARLGLAGQDGWLDLRVYHTTGRDFDGTNANDYFDIRVERHDREYFVMIRRPTSTIHVEIGVRTHEGFFQPIARSGRAEFPRSSPSPDAHLEWMTVTSEDAPPCVAPYRSRFSGPESPLPGRTGAGYVDVWRAGYAPSMPVEKPVLMVRPTSSSNTPRRSFERHGAHIERWWRLDEWRAEWRAGLRFFRWEHYDPQRVAVELLGETPVHVTVEGGEMVAYGPWRLTIRGVEGTPGRRVLATWSMRWLRASTPLIERWGHAAAGFPEPHHLLEHGASELWLGGSERMWLGASEWLAAGASEALWLGASPLGGSSDQHAVVSGERWGGR